MPECDNVPHKGWSGVMSQPRVLTLDADGLHAAPVPGADRMPGVERFSVRREELPLRWTVCCSGEGAEVTTLELDADGTLRLDRSRSSVDGRPSKRPIVRHVPLREVNDVLIATDRSTVEVAVNGRWLSARIYPATGWRNGE